MMSQKTGDSREDVTGQLISGGGEIGCHLAKSLGWRGEEDFCFGRWQCRAAGLGAN